MAIEVRVERIRGQIDKIRRYNQLVVEDSLLPATIEDIQGNAKDLCNEIKAEADLIKTEIDQWG